MPLDLPMYWNEVIAQLIYFKNVVSDVCGLLGPPMFHTLTDQPLLEKRIRG